MNTQEMKGQLAKLVSQLEGRTVEKVYFTGCGGGLANLKPAEHLLKQHLDEGRVLSAYCADLMLEDHPGVNDRAVVIVGCFNGTMKEPVTVMRWAQKQKAFVIGVTYTPDTPIATEPDFAFLCEHLEYEEPALTPMGAGVLLSSAILKALTGDSIMEDAWENLQRIKPILAAAEADIVAVRKKEFTDRFRNAAMIYTMGGGLNYTNAYVLATCYLAEMQWINACPVNASEFFHGVLEMADKDSKFIVMLGRGKCRPVEERAYDFLKRFTRGTFVIDAQEFEMDSIASEWEETVAFIVTARVVRSLIHALADARYHPLSTRRYYLKSEY